MQVVLNKIETQEPIRIQPERRVSKEEFYDLCAANPDLRIELTAEGEIVIMPPTGAETGYRNSELTAQLRNWTLRDGRGRAFDSSTEYLLPDGSAMSPDASWVDRPRLSRLTREQKRKFPPLAPDFVVELTSPADRLPRLRKKMEAWSANGVRLGWLLDRPPHRLHLPAAPRGGKTRGAGGVEGRWSRRRVCARTGRDMGPGYLTPERSPGPSVFQYST